MGEGSQDGGTVENVRSVDNSTNSLYSTSCSSDIFNSEEIMENEKTGIDFILTVLKGAEKKVIDDKKCFIVSLRDLYRVQFVMLDGGFTMRSDDKLTRSHGLENYEIRMSSLEKEAYYVCAKSEPLLDQLWEAKN